MRHLLRLLLIAGTIYAPLELSRYIIEYGLTVELQFELYFIWVLYITTIILISKRIKG